MSEQIKEEAGRETSKRPKDQEAGPFQSELRRPGAASDLREREEVGGRAFERPEPTAAGFFGKAAIRYIAEPFNYPLSREDFLACAGDRAFAFRRGESVLARDVMAKVQESSFESADALVDALAGVLEERSGEGSTEGSSS